ncbi:MAG: class I SAM-dependent methyltransferase [Cyclobacteriaceae bacterium]|nr:class I SAM-dependent methyltransferase [Cyclobacteriaceae bacterium]
MKATLLFVLLLCSIWVRAQNNPALDARVEKFLKEHRGEWRDMNVPYEDGKILHDLIVKNGYTSALEIGTSTGHSTIWLAWAMSKTGGKVITLELNERRHAQALKNLEEAGLSAFVDARLGNAHQLVNQLPGPYDFVFSDADKDWYKQYFVDLEAKLKAGGCYTTHNVADGQADSDFMNYVKNHPQFTTTIDRTSRAGIMISYKKK